MAKTSKRGRGRPPKPVAARKRNNLTIRLRDQTKAAIEKQAADNQRSLSEEAEHRLERSFDFDAELGGQRTAALIKTIARAMNATGSEAALLATGRRVGDGWLSHPYSYDQAVRAVVEVLKIFRPPGEIVLPRVEEHLEGISPAPGEDQATMRRRFELVSENLGKLLGQSTAKDGTPGYRKQAIQSLHKEDREA